MPLDTKPRRERARVQVVNVVRAIGAALSWAERGACYGDDDDTMYPRTNRQQERVAMRCRVSCDVVEECLDYAIRTDQRHGVWGGTTERQREQHRKAQRAKAQK